MGKWDLFQFLEFVFPVVVIECAAEEDDLSSDDICTGEISLFSAVYIHLVQWLLPRPESIYERAGRRKEKCPSFRYLFGIGVLLRVCTRWDGGEHDHADSETNRKR